VLKEILQDWRAQNDIYSITAECRHIRLPIDAVPDRHILIFEYLEKHELDLVKEDIPLTFIKRILHHTLQEIAGLHARGVSHNGW
jgi:phage terminase Nu1 subunit (DNA packaging protein)